MGEGVLLDICGGREAGWIASNVDCVWILVDSDVIDTHRRREREQVVLDRAEALGNAQVHDEVLRGRTSARYEGGVDGRPRGLTIGSCGMGRPLIPTTLSGPMMDCWRVHASFPLATQEMYWPTFVRFGSPDMRLGRTYRITETRFILERVE